MRKTDLINLLVPFVLIRKRWVFWILLPVSLIGFLYFGYKDAGSYRGHTAGSILSPDKWQNIITQSSKAGQARVITDHLEQLRGANAGAFSFFGTLLVLTLILAVVVSKATRELLVITNDFLENDVVKSYLVRQYEMFHGNLPATWLDDVAPMELNNFVVEQVTPQPSVVFSGAPAGVQEGMVEPLRRFLATALGKIYKLTL